MSHKLWPINYENLKHLGKSHAVGMGAMRNIFHRLTSRDREYSEEQVSNWRPLVKKGSLTHRVEIKSTKLLSWKFNYTFEASLNTISRLWVIDWCLLVFLGPLFTNVDYKNTLYLTTVSVRVKLCCNLQPVSIRLTNFRRKMLKFLKDSGICSRHGRN